MTLPSGLSSFRRAIGSRLLNRTCRWGGVVEDDTEAIVSAAIRLHEDENLWRRYDDISCAAAAAAAPLIRAAAKQRGIVS
jgi:hypothetical protein